MNSARPCVLVVGSAHLDILARASLRDDVIDRQGSVSIEIGGTAFNIANDLCRVGARVRLMSAMGTSAYSRMIESYLQEQGIETAIVFDATLPPGGFSAHLDTHGEMVSAISCMPIEHAMFDDGKVLSAMQGMQAVVADCNLGPRMLGRLVTLANDTGVPVFLCATSEEKSLRMSGLAGTIEGIFLNQREYEFFCRHEFDGRVPPPQETARHMKTTFVLTRGDQGTLVVDPQGQEHTVAPADIGEGGGSRLGMGDALAAGTIFHYLKGQPLPQAVASSMHLVAEIGQSPNCHSGRPDTLEHSINRVMHRAGHDAMTGVLNRHSTERMLGASMERRRQGLSEHLALLILDIDHFKSINDVYGHNVGDEVIIEVTRTAQRCLRAQDYIGRWGGEEFIVVLPDAPHQEALMVAERIRGAIQETILHPRPVTISIGCSEMTPGETPNIRALVEQADKALYVAKRSGRNRVVSVHDVPEELAAEA